MIKKIEPALAKRIIIILIGIAVLMGGIFIYHLISGIMMGRQHAALAAKPITVSTTKVTYQEWEPLLRSTASLRATQGVEVTTELAGMVREILFKPGQTISAGNIIVKLNIEPDVAQLHSLQAVADLAKITYERDKLQYAAHGISKETLDTDLANLQNAQAQVQEQQANIDKKIIRAPFSGKLGVSQVNLGQYLNPGDNIVNLQSLDPIWVDFYIPQQEITNVQVGQQVKLTSSTYPNRLFTGKITSIDSRFDNNTRNIEIEATVPNPKKELFPGMFGEVMVSTGEPEKFLTVPQAAISYNPYGDLVYIVEKEKVSGKTKKKDQKKLIVKQKFVTLGETRGDQVVILSGLKEGDVIVTGGQLKIKNGSSVVINNSIVPDNNPNPHPIDE